ncbi:hypothetical protein E2562_012102 [Oryza meyeriana var. granulata]|uniref:Uncharacterized protein n=1 Tax=Oryza meyeriana var. granulata TaxID=110450 RepID=A0A6G1F7I4_9ORYZ|nr:hypothetical protein E2562_012102 [Oryza meyeriana var. granulata]
MARLDDGVVRDINGAPVSSHFFVAEAVSEGEQAAVVENECEASDEIAFVQSENEPLRKSNLYACTFILRCNWRARARPHAVLARTHVAGEMMVACVICGQAKPHG